MMTELSSKTAFTKYANAVKDCNSIYIEDKSKYLVLLC